MQRGQAFENMVESAQTGAPPEPDMTHAVPLSKQHAAAVERACRALEAEQPPDLNTLAEQAGMSRFHFHRIFKSDTGFEISPGNAVYSCSIEVVFREESLRSIYGCHFASEHHGASVGRSCCALYVVGHYYYSHALGFKFFENAYDSRHGMCIDTLCGLVEKQKLRF